MANPCSSGNGTKQFLVTDWNPPVSVDQEDDINNSRSLSCYNVGEPKNQINDGLEQFPGSSFLSSEDLLSSVNSFDILKSTQTACALYPPNVYLTNKYEIEKNLKGKRMKNMYGSPHSQDMAQNFAAEQHKIPSPECAERPTQKEEKKQKSKTSGGISLKPNAKTVNDCSQDDYASKEDYIHVRAKCGQATNSHSLAERVRREKINERMRLLQDLVPGCNKINGKAMMLDEIINYVQSLQRQVELLSMKLAAVNPELQFDIERILSNNIIPPQDVNLAVFGYSLGMSTSHPHMQGSSSHGIVQPEMMMYTAPNSADLMRSSFHHVSPMTQLQEVWDDELENYSSGFHA